MRQSRRKVVILHSIKVLHCEFLKARVDKHGCPCENDRSSGELCYNVLLMEGGWKAGMVEKEDGLVLKE